MKNATNGVLDFKHSEQWTFLFFNGFSSIHF